MKLPTTNGLTVYETLFLAFFAIYGIALFGFSVFMIAKLFE